MQLLRRDARLGLPPGRRARRSRPLAEADVRLSRAPAARPYERRHAALDELERRHEVSETLAPRKEYLLDVQDPDGNWYKGRLTGPAHRPEEEDRYGGLTQVYLTEDERVLVLHGEGTPLRAVAGRRPRALPSPDPLCRFVRGSVARSARSRSSTVVTFGRATRRASVGRGSSRFRLPHARAAPSSRLLLLTREGRVEPGDGNENADGS